MTEGVSLDDLEGDPVERDFRRAQGAPLVRRVDDPAKWDRYSRPSGWGKDLDDESALVLWKIDRAMEGVASDPGLRAMVAANIGNREGAKDRRERAIQRGRGEEGSDQGTALHKMTALVEADTGYVVPPPFDADVAAYLQALDAAGLTTEYIEVQLVNDAAKAAGTADRIYQVTRELALPSGDRAFPGQRIIGDLKCGQKLTYSVPGYAIQMALYADSVFYDTDHDVRSELPEDLRTDWSLIVHLPVGEARCDLLWCDLQVGRVGARIVEQVRAWRRRDDFLAEFAFPADDEVPVLSSPMNRLAFGSFEVGPEPDVPDGWYEAMAAFAQQRIDFIGHYAEPRATLIRRWPEAVPPLRDGLSNAQLTTILSLLDTIEAAYSLPFPGGDPRVEWDRGLHKTEVNRSNEPRSNEQ